MNGISAIDLQCLRLKVISFNGTLGRNCGNNQQVAVNIEFFHKIKGNCISITSCNLYILMIKTLDSKLNLTKRKKSNPINNKITFF